MEHVHQIASVCPACGIDVNRVSPCACGEYCCLRLRSEHMGTPPVLDRPPAGVSVVVAHRPDGTVLRRQDASGVHDVIVRKADDG